MNDPERGEGVKLSGCESLGILGAEGELFRSTYGVEDADWVWVWVWDWNGDGDGDWDWPLGSGKVENEDGRFAPCRCRGDGPV